jgi:hypothetical protein
MARTTTLRQRPIQDFAGQIKPFDTNTALESKKRKLQTVDEEDSDTVQTTRTIVKKRRVVPLVTPPRTPTPPALDNSSLIEDLNKLNAAFLLALSLHYAHNGLASSVDLRLLLPSVTRAWGKRTVTLDDIAAVVGVYNDGYFRLINFGDGKVCIEKSTSTEDRASRKRHLDQVNVGPRFNEKELRNEFAVHLDQAWQTWKKWNPSDADNFSKFTSSLTNKHSLEESSTIRKIAPLRSRGQQRLEEVLGPLKNIHISDDVSTESALAKRIKRDHSTTTSPKRPQLVRTTSTLPGTAGGSDKENNLSKHDNTASRSASLLDRIRAKEALSAAQPAGLTKEDRERLAALQRAEQLLEMLNSLAVSKGGFKVSFPLPSLVTSVKASIRNPMSKDEIVRCVMVLQQEIAPGHISLVTFGSITGVVVDRSRKPAAGVVKERLRERGV